MKQYAVILACVAGLGCGGAAQTTEDTGHTEQASSIAGWSGFMGYGTACLTANSATLGAGFNTSSCSTSNPLQNFSLNTSAQLHAQGVSATAFTQHQGLCLKNANGNGCSGLCLGYSGTNATLVSCTSRSESVNDIGYGWGALYTNNGGTRCLNNVASGGGLPWGTCNQDSQTSWENMGFTCIFNASQGTPQSQYLESDFGSLGLSLFTQPFGSTVIDGIPQPANSEQEFCTLPVLNTLAYNVSAIEQGTCSSNTGMWLTPTNPTGPTTNYKFVSTSSPTSYFTDRDTIAPGVIDSVLSTLTGLEFAVNPQSVGNLETAVQTDPSAASGVEPRCVSGL